MTAEFCGEKKVKRPSCSDTGVKRVVGYFEGWAPTRKCQSFKPEDVPVGVYTHINFAFAVIDPVLYRIAPASASDMHLYKQVTDLKRRDKNLKVFIAIGGWTYNDPGPTRETFSRLAADPAKQKVFFKSLVSFMNTYNFDGVDIDWEYPGAEDRGGRDGDFENMPVFIGNMRKALQSSGTGRAGVTMALPVAYWYLRHFDIKKVAPHVDFFNMMSYDLHGSWDKTIEWVGPYLNSHTNLTEITEYLDLLWRNDIPPAKVNMGLGFYTRHFTAASESCMSPGCRYESAGPRGPCTDEIGVLSNAEIMDLEARPGPPAALDPEAAVKVLKRGREWITYDDETTWKLKVARASELCLGGVMVWAISQDTAAGRFSRELQAATGYRSPGTSTFDLGDGDLLQAATQDTLIDQCRWSGCGKGCPSGYIVVPRRDGHHTDGVMRAPTGCSGGQTSIFCCPAKEAMPWCMWQDFNNGRCGSKQQSQCNQGYVEIGSHSAACRSNALWQVGCCMAGGTKAKTVSTKNYGACRWQGTPPRCGFDAETDGTDGACKNAGNREYLLHSKGGSGGALCREGNGLDYDRAYCCDTDSEGVSAWGECVWRGGQRDGSGHCASDCPPDTVRVAFEPVAKCLTGGRSSCCSGIAKTDRRRNVGDRWRSALEAAMNGQCKGVFSVFDKRDAPPDRFEALA